MGLMASIVAAFSGPFGTILNKILLGVFIISVLGGLYFLIVHQAKSEQQAIDQKAVLEQVVKNQQDFIQKTQAILEAQQAATVDLNNTIGTIEENTRRINTDLNNPDVAKTDRPSSDILKSVVRNLSGEATPKTQAVPLSKIKKLLQQPPPQ